MKQPMNTRRSLMTGLGAAAAAAVLVPASGGAQSGASAFRPARHQRDSWMDELKGQHRVFIDSCTPSGGAEALLYANNLYLANDSGYSLKPSDLAIIVCLRHFSTPFAYNDAAWKKYGKAFSGLIGFKDPRTGMPPSTNLMNSADYGFALPNFGVTLKSLIERGTQFAVCDMATNFMATQIAQDMGASKDNIYKELVASVIPNGHFVAAERVQRQFGRNGAIGENIMMSKDFSRAFDPQGFARRAVQGWMESEGHRENMLSARYQKSGVGVVISGHVAGMYALAPISGRITQRFGALRTIFLGTGVLVAASLIAALAPPTRDELLFVALFLLGWGWNLGFVAGSTLLTASVSVAQRTRVQGIADAVIWTTSAAASLGSGAVVAAAGFSTLGFLGVGLVLAPVWLLLNRRQAIAALTAS